MAWVGISGNALVLVFCGVRTLGIHVPFISLSNERSSEVQLGETGLQGWDATSCGGQGSTIAMLTTSGVTHKTKLVAAVLPNGSLQILYQILTGVSGPDFHREASFQRHWADPRSQAIVHQPLLIVGPCLCMKAAYRIVCKVASLQQHVDHQYMY